MEFFTDRDILKGTIVGDREAQKAFVKMFSDPIYRSIQYAFKSRNVPCDQSDMEDLYNTIFVKLFENRCKKLRRFQGKNGCSLLSWVRIVSVNIVLDHIRKMRTNAGVQMSRTLSLDAVAEPKGEMPDPCDLMERAEQVRLIEMGLQTLLPRDRLFLKLHFQEDMSIRKVASMLGLTESNAHSLKSRALKRLRERITQQMNKKGV